jgi:hypothetical protein
MYDSRTSPRRLFPCSLALPLLYSLSPIAHSLIAMPHDFDYDSSIPVRQEKRSVAACRACRVS